MAQLAAAVGVALVVFLAHAGWVWAKPPATAAGTEGLADIRKFMDQGQALFVAKQYKQAAEVFERGFREHPYSAFLYNAGVCHQKAGENARALEQFHHYLEVDPSAPDADRVRARIAAIEAIEAAKNKPGRAPETPSSSSTEAAVMKSLVVIETEPPGAPVAVYARVDPSAGGFEAGGNNPGWTEVVKGAAPTNLTVDVGHYHVVIEKFRDFNASSTDVDVEPGHVHQIKVNLSQGEFMAFLRVTANVRGARIFLDDAKKQRPAWGTVPHAELVSAGSHTIHVEAPGFEPLDRSIDLKHGEQKELDVDLERVKFGYLEIDGNVSVMRLSVDDQPVDSYFSGQSAVSVKLDAGRHRLHASADGFKTYTGMVDVPRGRVAPVHVRLIQKYPRGAAWTQAIIGGVVFGTGIYFGVASNQLHSDLDADRQRGVLEQNDGRITRGKVYSVVADVCFGAGGLLGLLATHSFLKDPTPDSGVHNGGLHEFRAGQSR